MKMIIDTSFVDDTLTVIADDKNKIQSVHYDYGVYKKGDVYAATVACIDYALNAIFVNFGGKKNGFLTIDNIHPMYFGYRERDLRNISERQVFMIQIEKEGHGTKGAYCSTYITLVGRYCVLMIDSKNNVNGSSGISKKIDDADVRRGLKEMFENMELPENVSVIFRSAALDATEIDVRQDMKFLVKTWDGLKRMKLSKIGLLYSEARGVMKALRDYGIGVVKHIRVMDERVLRDVKGLVEMFYKDVTIGICSKEDRKLLCGEEMSKALYGMVCDKVRLMSGGYICIAPTEALTAVDVNSGKQINANGIGGSGEMKDREGAYNDNEERYYNGTRGCVTDDDRNSMRGKDLSLDLAFNTNKEAAKETISQVLARNITGQIVIDFIEMEDDRCIEEIERIVKDGFKLDKARVKIGKMSKFSMMEISRQRIGLSVYDWLLQKCKYCVCAGYAWNEMFFARKHLRSVWHQLYILVKNVEVVRIGNNLDVKSGAGDEGRVCRVLINSRLLEYLISECIESIREIEETGWKKRIDVKFQGVKEMSVDKCEIKIIG